MCVHVFMTHPHGGGRGEGASAVLRGEDEMCVSVRGFLRGWGRGCKCMYAYVASPLVGGGDAYVCAIVASPWRRGGDRGASFAVEGEDPGVYMCSWLPLWWGQKTQVCMPSWLPP